MIERKKTEFLSYEVIIELRDSAPEGWNEIACGGCYDQPNDDGQFKVWFNFDQGPVGLKAIVHECWHLFMSVMHRVDTHDHKFEELNNEIYAYNFHVLFGNVLGLILDSKMYKKSIEEEDNPTIIEKVEEKK